MDSEQKKIYLRANQLYKQGKTADALKLWESIGGRKTKSAIELQPIIWRVVHSAKFGHIQFKGFAFYISIFLLSIFFGRLAASVLIVTGDLLHFKNYSIVYDSLYDLSQSEVYFFNSLPHDFWNIQFSELLNSIQNYLCIKIVCVQNILMSSSVFLSDQKSLHELLFNETFLPALLLVTFGVIVDGILIYKFSQIGYLWLIKIYKSHELQLRFVVTFSMIVLCIGFYVITYKTFVTKPVDGQGGWLSKIVSGNNPNQSEDESSGVSSKEEKAAETEKDFLKNVQEQLMSQPLSMNERKAIMRMIEDYKKLLQKYGIRGSGKDFTASELVEKLRNGNMKDIEKELQRQKAMKKYEEFRNEFGSDSGAMSMKDKEFSEIIKKSFKGSDKDVLEEFLKTNKEFEELFGKNNSDKIFKNKREEILKGLSQDSQQAREAIRKELRQMAEEQVYNEGRGLPSIDDDDLEARILSIRNYLATGGDIKVFNQMRMKFLKDCSDPKLRYIFVRMIEFVIASWNEHQNKYFWQMNRVLMMEMIEMNIETAKAVKVDVRSLDLGWFYLVAGDYKKAREACLQSIAYSEETGDTDSERTSVNRSNAALSILMMQDGKTAYIEYRAIYQKIMSYGDKFLRKREELFTEYIREITASLASDTPCKEGYLCRSLFLEEVNDELALDDLLKYLSLSPSDILLEKEARLKARLIKDRIAKRKQK